MEFLSKSMEIGLESSWSISRWNPVRNSFQNQWKLVWGALGQFPNGVLKEFLSKSMEICLERILMEFISNPWKVILRALGQFRLLSQWNPFGIPFKINGNWSEENPYGIPFKINGNWFGENP